MRACVRRVRAPRACATFVRACVRACLGPTIWGTSRFPGPQIYFPEVGAYIRCSAVEHHTPFTKKFCDSKSGGGLEGPPKCGGPCVHTVPCCAHIDAYVADILAPKSGGGSRPPPRNPGGRACIPCRAARVLTPMWLIYSRKLGSSGELEDRRLGCVILKAENVDPSCCLSACRLPEWS